jgi:hypothetical protein
MSILKSYNPAVNQMSFNYVAIEKNVSYEQLQSFFLYFLLKTGKVQINDFSSDELLILVAKCPQRPFRNIMEFLPIDEATEVQVFDAYKLQNVHYLEWLLKHNGPIESNKISGCVHYGYLEMMKCFIEYNDDEDSDDEDSDDEDPGDEGKIINCDTINHAVERNHLDIVKYLVEYGVKLSGNSIILAARNGKIDIVKYLIDKPIFNEDCMEYNPIIEAAEGGHLEIVKFLVEYGLDLDFDEDILIYPIQNNDLEMIKYLIEQGVMLTDDDILKAFEYGYLEIAEYLIEQHTLKNIEAELIQ